MREKVLIINSDADWFVSQLSAAYPTFSFSAAQSSEQAMETAPKADILIGLAPALSEPLLLSMTNLKWIHALTTGVDNLVNSSSLSPDVFLSNSSGFHGPQMSELAVLLMLSTLRDYPRMLENQKAKRWERWPQPLLYGRTACIVGLGSIAEALVERLLAFGMTVTGVSDGRSRVPGVARVYRRSELVIAAGDTDFLIVLVPYSAGTHHLVNDAVIAAMRPDAILINLSRGGCVDEDALTKHIQAGTIRAAALDVFEQEPLPKDNALWGTPGITLTPHIGGMSDIYREQVLPSVINNLNAWARGGGSALPDRIKHGETR
ncbi:MAG: D-2-hydroxyacid dehydrogenase [Geminicoccaceae bacterium]